MKKTEVEVVLEEFLVKNASHLANEARLRPFYESYQRRAGGSPVKREPSSVVSVIERKSVRRRTRMADEISEVNETQTYVQMAREARLACFVATMLICL